MRIPHVAQHCGYTALCTRVDSSNWHTIELSNWHLHLGIPKWKHQKCPHFGVMFIGKVWLSLPLSCFAGFPAHPSLSLSLDSHHDATQFIYYGGWAVGGGLGSSRPKGCTQSGQQLVGPPDGCRRVATFTLGWRSERRDDWRKQRWEKAQPSNFHGQLNPPANWPFHLRPHLHHKRREVFWVGRQQ